MDEDLNYPPFAFSPTQGVSPEVLQRMNRGLVAQGELEDLRTGSAMGNALRMAQAQFDGTVQGSGLSATSPGIANALSTLAQQYVGNQRLSEMQQQAKALRGEMGSGQLAEQEAEMARAAYAERAKQANINAQMNQQQRLAENAQRAREELEAQKQRNRVELAREKAALSESDEETVAKVPTRFQEPYRLALTNVNQSKRIQSAASGLSSSDIVTLNKPLIRTALTTLSPNAVKNLAQKEGLKFSDDAVRFLNAVNGLSTERRHQLFGTQVTQGEEGMAVSILPNAPDLDLDSMMMRVDEGAEKSLTDISAIQEATARLGGKAAPNLMEGLDYKKWQTSKDSSVSDIDKQIQDLADQLGLTPEQLNAL